MGIDKKGGKEKEKKKEGTQYDTGITSFGVSTAKGRKRKKTSKVDVMIKQYKYQDQETCI